MKTVKEIMFTTPKYCGKNDSLKNVVKEMANSNIGSLPVVDKEKKVIGIITNRDICATLGKTEKAMVDIKVHEAMTHTAHTCRTEDDTSDALKIMRLNKVKRLPVIDAEGTLKGLLSLNTIVHQFEGSKDREEIEHNGEENVVKTLRSIADRKYEHAAEW